MTLARSPLIFAILLAAPLGAPAGCGKQAAVENPSCGPCARCAWR